MNKYVTSVYVAAKILLCASEKGLALSLLDIGNITSYVAAVCDSSLFHLNDEFVAPVKGGDIIVNQASFLSKLSRFYSSDNYKRIILNESGKIYFWNCADIDLKQCRTFFPSGQMPIQIEAKIDSLIQEAFSSYLNTQEWRSLTIEEKLKDISYWHI